ncbi:MAG: hypothetical protein L0H79_21460 [Intrasporangium sp.]|uniref:hypothetical protein n=1 Tax=Intrasporangium sp. TaxID=1925024 RepID=UPI00264A2C95|nr:hypothetical protein [Intrasporangium sp.]MDN5798296.1 hypothetical protein [Intrasporangium sp.]
MSKLPHPVPSLLRRLEAIERQLVQKGSPFTGTGVRPNGLQGLDSDNYVPGASGFSLNGGAGTAEFKDITLYDLPNSALASPVLPANLHADTQTFNVKVAWQTIISVSITVPAGYTRALILNLVTAVVAYNNTAKVEFLYVQGSTSAGNVGGWPLGSGAVGANGGTAVGSDFRTGLLTGLVPGSALTFTGSVSSSFGTWASSTSNLANLDVALLWLR